MFQLINWLPVFKYMYTNFRQITCINFVKTVKHMIRIFSSFLCDKGISTLYEIYLSWFSSRKNLTFCNITVGFPPTYRLIFKIKGDQKIDFAIHV